jgi:hypothetical protein
LCDRIALLFIFTVGVMEANREWRSTASQAIRVSYERHWTRALEPSRQIGATGARTTRNTFFQTFIDIFAFLIGTNVSIATISIDFTFNRYFSALSQWISSISGQTRTLRLVFLCSTNCIDSTHTSYTAWTLTETINTRLIERTVIMHSTSNNAFLFQTYSFQTTVFIISTFRRNFSAFEVRIASKTTRAVTYGYVIGRRTNCFFTTSAAMTARIDTFASNTSLVCWAMTRCSATKNTALILTNMFEWTLRIISAFRRW